MSDLIDTAGDIYDAVPDRGVSKDAILIALAMRRYGTRPAKKPSWQNVPDELPQWFLDACERFKGRHMQIGTFAMMAGHRAESKRELNQIGEWMRRTGRKPRKVGGITGYDI